MSRETPTTVSWLLRKKIFKSEWVAVLFLFFIAVAFGILSFYFFTGARVFVYQGNNSEAMPIYDKFTPPRP